MPKGPARAARPKRPWPEGPWDPGSLRPAAEPKGKKAVHYGHLLAKVGTAGVMKIADC